MRRFMRAASLLILIAAAPAAVGTSGKSAPEKPQKSVASVQELVQMGNAMADLKRFDEAITAYTLALEQEPENPTALANRALAFAWTNRIEEASRDLAAAERILPDMAVIHRVRAIIANRRSDDETELTELTKSLRLEPANPFALTFRSSIYQRRQQYEAALADADAYIRARPNEPEAYEMRAEILAAQRNWPLALKQADMLATRFGRDPQALASAARIYADHGDRGHGLKLMAQAIALDDGFYYFWKVRAGLRRWDDFSGRRLDLDQALELAPGDLSIIAELGLLEFDQRNWKAAHARFSEVLAKDSRDYGVLAYRAMTNLQIGDAAAAKNDYEAAVAVAAGPGDLSRICSHFAREGLALDWARTACDRAVAADATRESYRVNRGLARLRLGDLEGAIADYDQAIATNPNSGPAYYGRAIAYHRQGNLRQARADRKLAVAISPTISETFVAHGLGDLERRSNAKSPVKLSPDGAPMLPVH